MSFFQLTREWQEGVLETQAECEDFACFPEPWITEQGECEQLEHCEGHCPYCDTMDLWNWEAAQLKAVCQLVDASGEPLSEVDCSAAGGTQNVTFTGDAPSNWATTFHKDRTGLARVCEVPTPEAGGSDITENCRGQQLSISSGGTTVAATFQLFRCGDLSNSFCGWAETEFPDLQCTRHWMPCRNRQDCDNAGRCEYGADSWQIEEAGGLCAWPHSMGEWDPIAGLADDGDTWQQCDGRREGNADLQSTMHRNYGCLATFNWGTTDQQSKCLDMGAKWFPFAWTRTECSVPGFAWARRPATNTTNESWAGAGTHSCCIRSYGEFCEEFSSDGNRTTCEACGGEWQSMFNFRSEAVWVQGSWAQRFTWQNRSFESENSWVTVPDHGRLTQLWDNVVMASRAGPLNNFIGCRINPTLQTLVAIANGELPTPTLGNASLIPQDEGAQDIGGVRVVTTAESNTLSTEVTIPLASEPSFSLIGTGGAVPDDVVGPSTGPSARNFRGYGDRYSSLYRGARHSRSGRNLQQSGSLTSLEASCYALISNGAGQRVGQVLGNCIAFSPSSPLSGTAELCLQIDSAIPVNPQFTHFAFARVGANTAINALPNTVTMSTDGTQMCANVQESATYCPSKTFAQTTGVNVVSADYSCGTLEAASSSVLSQANAFIESGAYAGVSLDGLSALASDAVDAPVTNGTSTVTRRATVFEGSFTLSVAGAANFASDPSVRSALQAAVASSIGGNITSDSVEITGITVDGVTVAASSSSRRLQSEIVVVSYRVTVPAGTDVSTVQSSIANMQPAAITAALTAELSSRGLDYTVEVSSIAAATQSLRTITETVAVTTTTTTMAPAPGTGTANSAWTACGLAPVNAAIAAFMFGVHAIL